MSIRARINQMIVFAYVLGALPLAAVQVAIGKLRGKK